MSIRRYPIPTGQSGSGPLDNLDVTGAAPGEVVAVTQVSPLGFGLLAPVEVDARLYGVTADGVTDDRAALQSAVDAAAALTSLAVSGVTLRLPSGRILLGSSHPAPPAGYAVPKFGVRLPVNLAGRLAIRGAGRGATAIVLSAESHNAFWIGQSAAVGTGTVTLGSTAVTGVTTSAGAFTVGQALTGTVGITAGTTVTAVGAGTLTLSAPATGTGTSTITGRGRETFRNMTFEDFDVDNASTPGRCHTLVGSLPGSNTVQNYLSFADLTFRRLRTYGHTQDLTQATTRKSFIALHGNHATGDGPGTQTSTRRVLCEDIDMVDVQEGILVNSRNGEATNHYHDDIRFRRCTHTISTFPGQILQQTSFFIAGGGFGGYCEIIDCTSTNIGDDGIEMGAMQTVMIERFRATNPFLIGAYFRMEQNPPDPESQTITMRDCTVTVTATANTAAGGTTCRPLLWRTENGTQFGTILLDGIVFARSGMQATKMLNGPERDLGFLINPEARRVEMIRCKVVLDGTIFDHTFSADYKLWHIATTSPDGVVAQTILRDCEAVLLNSTGPAINAINANVHALWPVGEGVLDVDGLHVTVNNWAFSNGGGGTLALAQVGRGGDYDLVRLRRIRGVRTNAAVFVASGVVLRSTGPWDLLDLDGLDTRAWATTGGFDVDYGSAPAGVGALTRIGPANLHADLGLNNYGRRRATSASETINPLVRQVGVTFTGSPRTITLPPVARVQPGEPITIKDETGGAATNNITVAAAASELIEGAASRTISTNYGSLRLYSTGTAWMTF